MENDTKDLFQSIASFFIWRNVKELHDEFFELTEKYGIREREFPVFYSLYRWVYKLTHYKHKKTDTMLVPEMSTMWINENHKRFFNGESFSGFVETIGSWGKPRQQTEYRLACEEFKHRQVWPGNEYSNCTI